jgi:hypothetical protein
MTFGFIAYALGLFALNYFYVKQSPYRYLLILLPILPLLYVASAIVRFISEMDEMWKKINIEALAFSALATGFTSFSYLFFRDMGAPEFRAAWVWFMMWIYYWIGFFFSKRRYK